MSLAHTEWKKELKYNREIESNQKNYMNKNKERERIFYKTDAFYTVFLLLLPCIVAYIDKCNV